MRIKFTVRDSRTPDCCDWYLPGGTPLALGVPKDESPTLPEGWNWVEFREADTAEADGREPGPNAGRPYEDW